MREGNFVGTPFAPLMLVVVRRFYNRSRKNTLTEVSLKLCIVDSSNHAQQGVDERFFRVLRLGRMHIDDVEGDLRLRVKDLDFVSGG